ncbi:MAG TPA: hypothetical protein VEL07_20230 [Planctomycetota bacterium]|nr:hypothetical protein [Planctomycetota bacterium]
MSARRAITLFEAAISSALVASAILTVMMLIPVGLRAQQQARFQLYASCKVLEMIDTFANHDHTFTSRQVEGQRLGQNPMHLKLPIDLDRMMITKQLGLLPLPNSIAQRIDSDGDEIAGILADGGRVYYASPIAYELGYHQRSGGQAFGALTNERVMPNEAQSILFGVVGYAQQNALPSHPCIAWPYSVNYPSTAGNGDWNHNQWAGNTWEWKIWYQDPAAGIDALNLGSGVREQFKIMCDMFPSWNYHAYNPQFGPTNAEGNWSAANPVALTTGLGLIDRMEKYNAAAREMATLLGIASTGTDPLYHLPAPPADLTTIAPPWDPSDPDDADVFPTPTRIMAIRLLAAGALMKTGTWMQEAYLNYADDYPGATPDPYTGPRVTPYTSAEAEKDMKYAQQMQEICMRWTRRYTTTNPYDWGAPRALNRAGAWDFPLLQFDLFAPVTVKTSDGTPYGGVDADDATYRITAPRLPTNFTRGYSFCGDNFLPPNHQFIASSWSRDAAGAFDTSNFNLAAKFAAAERCRQIVCWAVDWKSYEDFESAPGGPYDASTVFLDSRGVYTDAEAVQHPPDWTIAWRDAGRTAVVPPPDATSWQSDPLAYKQSFFGVWGADRNGNGVWDRGPLPASTRMRALPVGRWNYYDRRMISALRN